MQRIAHSAMLALLAGSVAACTTVYTESDVEAEESRLDASADAEEAVDGKIGEQLGGDNLEQMREEEDDVERQSGGL